jgi:hypothetical protein
MAVRRIDLLVPIKDMHESGMSVRAIASATGILHLLNPPDQYGMIHASKARGLDGKVRLNRQVDTTDRDARIRELQRAGKPVRAIAAETECSIGTVHRVLRGTG